jgi:hypothetical protein
MSTTETPTTVSGPREVPIWARLILLVAMPVFFLTVFSLSYVSAYHKPTPHDLSLVIAGPAATTKPIVHDITSTTKTAFDITTTTAASSARADVKDRNAVGAVLIDGKNVTTVIASGGGLLASNVVTEVGQEVAARLGGTATVTDVSPLTHDDGTGSSLFYFLVACTVGAFLAITTLAQVLARPRMWSMLAVNAIMAILVPICSFVSLTAFTGEFGATFGEIAAVLGIGMLYTLACGLFATLMTRLIGAGGIFIEIIVLVGLNFPSSGGSVPASMLPPFWQFLHHFWIGAGAMEAFHSILYFSGAHVGRWVAQLFIWLGAIAALTAATGLLTRKRPENAGDPLEQTGPLATAIDDAAEVAAAAAV